MHTSVKGAVLLYGISVPCICVRKINRTILPILSAVGCANIDIPTGMWMRREGDNLLVKCNLTEETWYLTCENESWKGRIGNCSSGNCFFCDTTHIFQQDVFDVFFIGALGVASRIFPFSFH